MHLTQLTRAAVACAIVALFSLTTPAHAEHALAGVDLSKPIHGEPVTMADLRGKVIFLEYWGINCPPCIASFPHLIEKQAKYAKTGRFTVIASHRQLETERAAKFCQEKGANFPVFDGIDVPAAPCGRGIPHAAIIDHTGKVVATGSPFQLLDQLEQYIAKAPGQFGEIVGEVEVAHHVSLAKKLEVGKPIGATYKKLESVASEGSGSEADEAKQLVAQVDKWIEQQQSEAATLSNTRPSQALAKLISLNSMLAGIPQQEAVFTAMRPLSQDPNVRQLIALQTQIDRLEDLRGKSSVSPHTVERLATNLDQRCDRILATAGISEGVRAEAQAMKQTINAGS